MMSKDYELFEDGIGYIEDTNVAIPKGANQERLLKGKKTNSVINKLHLIKIHGDFPAMEKDIPNNKGFFEPKTVTDLCKLDEGAQQYDVEDFLYCKNLGFPINRLITLRRFPYPCTDNIYEKQAAGEPDIARMVTYITQETNKLDDLLSFSYGLKWKELTAEMEQASMYGDQSGLSGFMKKVGNIMDDTLNKNAVSGRSTGGPMSQYDPKFDQNKVYGPVDSITNTHIRDVGLEFNKEFEITFEYELRSIGGRTPEYAFKDLIGNILACTYNNGKFWPGARYWVGERPTNFAKRIAYLNSENVDEILQKATADIKSGLKQFFGDKQSSLNTLKQVLKGGFALALGKILDSVGRPGILAMNSLLSAEPTGFWHLTIGNPIHPILSIGNLILTGVDFKFPTDSLSYGDFPNKLQVIVKLKPGQAKDRAGIEMMFNRGMERMYYAPKNVKKQESKNVISKQARSFFNYTNSEVDAMLSEAYDFIADGVKSITETAVQTYDNLTKNGDNSVSPSNKNFNSMKDNAQTV